MDQNVPKATPYKALKMITDGLVKADFCQVAALRNAQIITKLKVGSAGHVNSATTTFVMVAKTDL